MTIEVLILLQYPVHANHKKFSVKTSIHRIMHSYMSFVINVNHTESFAFYWQLIENDFIEK